MITRYFEIPVYLKSCVCACVFVLWGTCVRNLEDVERIPSFLGEMGKPFEITCIASWFVSAGAASQLS